MTMMSNRMHMFICFTLCVVAAAALLPGCESPEDEAAATPAQAAAAQPTDEPTMKNKTQKQAYPLAKSDEQWRKELTPEQYEILRKKGTERAFTGEYWDNKEEGTYVCAGCAQPLYSSQTKFESGTGWPSFWQAVSENAVATEDDSSWFMKRTELLCSNCGGHLGHVFNDGPQPTGMRHCINSASLKFVPAEEQKK